MKPGKGPHPHLAVTPSDPVAVHPERVPGDPATLRWVLPEGAPVAFFPEQGGPLSDLLAQGTLRRVTTEPGALLTCLGEGRHWREDGAAVRAAVIATVRDPQPVTHDDPALRRAVLEVLEGSPGDYVRSHGGRAELIEAAQGRVVLRLSGACSHCPAAGITIDRMLEREIRSRYPALVEVRRGR